MSSALPETDTLLWRIVHRVEQLAASQYAQHVPELDTARKQRLLQAIEGLVPELQAPLDPEVEAPVRRLLEASRRSDAEGTLMVQGLLLEPLGEALYRLLERSEGAHDTSRQLARIGQASAQQVTGQVPDRIRAILDEERRFERFASESAAAIGVLDEVGAIVDDHFGQAFDLYFAGWMAETTAWCLDQCLALGMDRRQVMVHLAGSMMR